MRYFDTAACDLCGFATDDLAVCDCCGRDACSACYEPDTKHERELWDGAGLRVICECHDCAVQVAEEKTA